MAEKPEDLNLPNSVITKIIKEVLPDGVNISLDARSAVARAASVFVLYATSCANNFALKGKRKTLNSADILAAVEEMDFKRFVVPLKNSLEVHRQGQKGKKQTMEPKPKEVLKKNDLEDHDKSRDEDEKMEVENPHKDDEKKLEN